MSSSPHSEVKKEDTFAPGSFAVKLKWPLLGLIFVCISFILSIGFGAIPISFKVILDSFLSFQPDNMEHQLIREVRLPRAITALLIGIALAAAGAIMQGITRNPLADPSIIGITHGAGLAIAIYLAVFSTGSYWVLLIWSFAGSAIAACIVLAFTVISKDRTSPVTLTLAGAALSMLFSALSTGIAIHYQLSQDLSFWFAGGLSGTKWMHVTILIPTVIIGLILSMWISRPLTILSMGEDVSSSLGQSNAKIRIIGLLAVIILSGIAVSIAGMIGFLGLIIPHIVRLLIGSDYRWIIPCSAICGALLLIISDIGARMVNPPFETPVSAITAILGVPVFLYLSRQKRRSL
ncbi:FecCD family ABC transporter permease [Bacillus suaedaesalsae]|uniref:Iron ABC transporter permease n=1 Tax=Bacillus suaedaesalsae TaxID=2810349 RepID=A0ABS2DKL6_9BACI|nr:iron ABC transporter permease [Bacillus suaedaesalsae]MBM6618942.1 iron ABC transporter permease [Bacillus suaedaesalsae]